MRQLLPLIMTFMALVGEAQARVITDNEARAAALAFIAALADGNVTEIRDSSDLPFLAEDDRVLENNEDFAAYFREAIAIARPDALLSRFSVSRTIRERATGRAQSNWSFATRSFEAATCLLWLLVPRSGA
jgi:hypothetical protein